MSQSPNFQLVLGPCDPPSGWKDLLKELNRNGIDYKSGSGEEENKVGSPNSSTNSDYDALLSDRLKLDPNVLALKRKSVCQPDPENTEGPDLQRKLELLNNIMDQEARNEQARRQYQYYGHSGYSEDSDYTSELSYPVGGQHPNSSASQFRTLANQLTTPPQPSLENSRESSYEHDDVTLDPPAFAGSPPGPWIHESKKSILQRLSILIFRANGHQSCPYFQGMDVDRDVHSDPAIQTQSITTEEEEEEGDSRLKGYNAEPAGEVLFYNSRPPNFKQYSSRQSSWYDEYDGSTISGTQKTDKKERGFNEKEYYEQSQVKKTKTRGRRPSLERQTTLFGDDHFPDTLYDPSKTTIPPPPHNAKPLIDTKIQTVNSSGYKTKKYQDSRYGSKNEDFQWDSGGGVGGQNQQYYSSYPNRTTSKSFDDEEDEVYYSTQQSYEDENYQSTDVTLNYTISSSRHNKHNTSNDSSRYYTQEEDFHYPPPRSKSSTPKCLPEIPRPSSSASTTAKTPSGRKNAQLPRIPQHSSLDYETNDADHRYGSKKYASMDNLTHQSSSKSSSASGYPSISSVRKANTTRSRSPLSLRLPVRGGVFYTISSSNLSTTLSYSTNKTEPPPCLSNQSTYQHNLPSQQQQIYGNITGCIAKSMVMTNDTPDSTVVANRE
ncbi:hypothetical protein WDU94_010514 [Cyamophila willieti]